MLFGSKQQCRDDSEGKTVLLYNGVIGSTIQQLVKGCFQKLERIAESIFRSEWKLFFYSLYCFFTLSFQKLLPLRFSKCKNYPLKL